MINEKRPRIHALYLLYVESIINEKNDRIQLCLLYVQSMISEMNDRIHVLCLLYVQSMISENMSIVDILFFQIMALFIAVSLLRSYSHADGVKSSL